MKPLWILYETSMNPLWNLWMPSYESRAGYDSWLMNCDAAKRQWISRESCGSSSDAHQRLFIRGSFWVAIPEVRGPVPWGISRAFGCPGRWKRGCDSLTENLYDRNYSSGIELLETFVVWLQLLCGRSTALKTLGIIPAKSFQCRFRF